MSQSTGKVVLVTGGSRGIGRAISHRFLREGWHVAVNYLRDDSAADEVVSAYPGRCRAYRCDVSRQDDVQEMVDLIESRFGPIEVLVNNAGLWRGGLIDQLSSAAFMEVLTVSLIGSKNCIASVLPYMRERRSGDVINVSSAVGLIGWKGDTAYASAKAGLIGLTRVVAKEVAADGIRVNCVVPGFIETDMTAEVSNRQSEQLRHRTLLDRVGHPREVAGMIYAIAVEGSYMTGSVVTIDGGLILGRDEPLLIPGSVVAHAAGVSGT